MDSRRLLTRFSVLEMYTRPRRMSDKTNCTPRAQKASAAPWHFGPSLAYSQAQKRVDRLVSYVFAHCISQENKIVIVAAPNEPQCDTPYESCCTSGGLAAYLRSSGRSAKSIQGRMRTNCLCNATEHLPVAPKERLPRTGPFRRLVSVSTRSCPNTPCPGNKDSSWLEVERNA